MRMIDIDVVVSWVDGTDAAHSRKRSNYIELSGRDLHENAINPHRWEESNELYYCLRSIETNAPWARRIWIVTDNQVPELSHLPPDFRAKIQVVDHVEIFGEFGRYLPTFNSLAIETMMWRIAGLSEHFVYFNDDVFVTAPVAKTDFFVDGRPVLRGSWADFTDLTRSSKHRMDPALMNHFNHIKAAEIMGYDARNLFFSAHAVHPMKKSVMEQLFAEHREEFVENIKHRFRTTDQFLAQGLFNHACIRTGDISIKTKRDYLHLAVGACDRISPNEARELLVKANAPGIKLLCVNDLPAVERKIHDVRKLLEQIIGSDSAAAARRA